MLRFAIDRAQQINAKLFSGKISLVIPIIVTRSRGIGNDYWYEWYEFDIDRLVSVFSILVVTTVLRRKPHYLDGAVLIMELGGNVTAGIPVVEEVGQSRTIEVSGLASTTTKDGMKNFFENTRRSGGGEIDEVEFFVHKGCAVVTFVLAESE